MTHGKKKIVAIVDEVFDYDTSNKPFGKRWDSQLVRLTPKHIDALRSGKLLAIDVRLEYVVYLEMEGGENVAS